MANTLRFKRGLASGIPTALAGEPLFTTDTFDLYIGNGTTNTRFQKYIASGATTQILRGDGSLYTFPLAISSPSAGQVLKYNGTSWVNDSDSGITGSGSAGQVAYFTGATTQAGSNNLFWNNSTARLGVGTNSPTAAVHAYSTVTGGQLTVDGVGAIRSGINFANGGTTYGQIYFDNNSPYNFSILQQYVTGGLILGTNNTERARITQLGNLHIGTFSSDSGEKLQVTGTMKVTGAATFNSTITGTVIKSTNGTIETVLSYSGSAGVVGTLTNHPLQFFVNNGSRMSLDASGNLVASASIQGTVLKSTNGTIETVLSYTGSTGVIGTLSNHPLEFYSNGASRMYLTTSGNLGLGVTPSAWSGGGAALQLSNGASLWTLNNQNLMLSQNSYFNGSSTIYIATAPASQYQQSSGTHIWRIAPSGTAGNAISFTQAMTLDASGRLLVGGTSTYDFNDAARLVVANTSANSTISIVSGTTSSGYLAFADGTSGTSLYSGMIQYDHNTNYMAFRTLAIEAMRLTSNQNLHIGTFSADSGEKLQVTGTAKITGATSFGSNVTLDNGVLYVSSGSGTAYSTRLSTVYTYPYIDTFLDSYAGTSYEGRLQFRTNSNAGALSTKLTIENSGIATFTSDILVPYDSTNRFIGIRYSATYYNGFVLNGNNRSTGIVSRSNDATDYIWFGTNDGSERARITNSGNLHIGTFSSDSGYKLRVNGTSYYDDNARFPNNKGVIFVQTGGTLLGSISMDTTNKVTIANNGFSGLSVATDHTFLGGNFSVGHSGAVFGGGTRAMSMLNGTAPSSSFADAFLMYSNDVTAGNAAPHFRTENGAVIKLYQETTSVGNSIFSQGGGNSVLDDSTFDGYTLRQIVKALRNQGILA